MGIRQYRDALLKEAVAKNKQAILFPVRCIMGGPMTNYFKWVSLSLALLASSVGAADPSPQPAELPVVETKLVAPVEYRAASAFAARGSAPLEIVLKIMGEFEGSTQHISQVNEGSETPSVTRITVVRDGLMDDSVRGERWDITLERTTASVWRIREVRRAWRCWRGEQLDRFATVSCP